MPTVTELHIHSPQVRATAKTMFPNARELSQQQCRWALFAMGLLGYVTDIDADTNILASFHDLGPLYIGNYREMPPEAKEAIQSYIKNHMPLVVTAISHLPMITVVPAPERAWELKEAGLYPPPFRKVNDEQGCADDLYRPGLSWYGINITRNPDGLIPTAYTHSGYGKGKGLKDKNTARDHNWIRGGMITDATCVLRELPTQKQLEEGNEFLFGKQ